MTVQNDLETNEDCIVQEDPGERSQREHYLKLEPTRREAPEGYLVEQHSGRIEEHFKPPRPRAGALKEPSARARFLYDRLDRGSSHGAGRCRSDAR